MAAVARQPKPIELVKKLIVIDQSDLIVFQLEVPSKALNVSFLFVLISSFSGLDISHKYLKNSTQNGANGPIYRLVEKKKLHCNQNKIEFNLMLTTSHDGCQVVLGATCKSMAKKILTYSVTLIAYKRDETGTKSETIEKTR